MAHRFGGIWTRKKIGILEDYLAFYTKALKNQPFTLHYVDAFAGTGSQNPKLLGSQRLLIPEEDFRGSARAALGVSPGFDRYHFNDLNPEHVTLLEAIKAENTNKSVEITAKDANVFVPEFCQSLRKNDRAVLFLDPFSTELDWKTVGHVAKSEKIDLWLLFPISVIFRMTPTDGNKIRPEWNKTLTRLLGTDDWEQALYKPKEKPAIEDMFDALEPDESTERLNISELENWVTNRLREIFSYVAKPVMLRNNNKPLFLFYFAVSNPNDKAWRLADKVAEHILKNHR